MTEHRLYNEDELKKALAKKDINSFVVLYNTYNSKLFYFALHYLDDNESAKDVVQDVFFNVWKDHEKMLKVNNISSWLYTLTKNICLKRIDHLKVQRKHDDILKYRKLNIVQNSLSELNTSPAIFEEIDNLINKTLNELSPKSRKIFELSRFENKKNREIASELNISQKTVEGHITQTLKKFRIALKDYLPFILFLINI